jgi:hypothetical protein
VLSIGDGRIFLRLTVLDLVEQGLDQITVRPHAILEVGVLLLKIAENFRIFDFGILGISQPGIGVFHPNAMSGEAVRPAAGDWYLRHGYDCGVEGFALRQHSVVRECVGKRKRL